MKHLHILSLAAAMLLSIGAAVAQTTETFDFSQTTTDDDGNTVSVYGLTIFSGSSSSYETSVTTIVNPSDSYITIEASGTYRLWLSSSTYTLRVYKGSSLTFTAADGYVITSIEFKGTSVSYLDSADSGTLSSGTWSGEAQSVVISHTGSSGNAQLTSIVVTYAVPSTVSTPVISLATGLYTEAQTVSITADEGATIYYSLNDGEYTQYTEALTISETTTLSAYAVLNDTQSNTASATYTFPIDVENIGAFLAANSATSTTLYHITGAVTVTYQKSSRLYVTDETGSLLIYGSTSTTYTNGQTLTGVIGSYTLYNNVPELIPSSFGTVGESGATVEPTAMTTMPTEDNISEYVSISGVTFDAESFSCNMLLGSESIVAYNQFYGSFTIDTSTTYDVVGIVGYYSALQFYPITITATTNTAISDTDVPSGDKVYRSAGSLKVEAAEGSLIEVYDLTGCKVAQVTATQAVTTIDGLTPGQLLIVSIDGRAQKIAL